MTKQQIEKRLDTLRESAERVAGEWRELVDDMQSYYDDRSEKWQDGEKGEEYQEMIDSVGEQVAQLDEVANFGL